MAEPIRKPVHRPRPPHPHTEKRPHAVLVRSRLVPEDSDQEAVLPRPAPVRPAPRLPPARAARPQELAPPPPAPAPPPGSLAALAPPEEPLAAPPVSEERSA